MTGENIKKLGFGMMRLPKTGKQEDFELMCRLVDRFLDAGCTYFDTAWVYEGNEELVRKVLVERHPRESYLLADKLAVWDDRIKTREDAIAEFDTSLARTGAGYFDFYLMHNICGETRINNDRFGIWEYLHEKKEKGLIRHLGFSYHGTPEELDDILTKHPETEFVQLQINYADWENAKIASRRCYETVRKHNKPIVVMEPVKGGLLASPPESVRAALCEDGTGLSPAAHAIRFAAGLPGVLTVLSGMNSPEQLEDNLSALKDFTVPTEAESAAIEKARAVLKAIPVIPCTRCNYCAKVCPKGIGISDAFRAMNRYLVYNNLAIAKRNLKQWAKDDKEQLPSECLGCGACEGVCPQHLEIRALLKRVAEELE